MSTNNKARLLACVALVALAEITMAAMFELSWYTIDGGGVVESTGGGFGLSGTIGQPDAGVVMTGGGFALTGGFWAAANDTYAPCPGDLNGDGVVDLTDLAILLSDFDCTGGCAGDVDADGDADLTDLAILLANFDAPCP